jgi:hypothetical protein
LRGQTFKALRKSRTAGCSGFAFGFPQPGNPVAGFPLTALFQKFQALKALKDVSFATQGGGGAQTTML